MKADEPLSIKRSIKNEFIVRVTFVTEKGCLQGVALSIKCLDVKFVFDLRRVITSLIAHADLAFGDGLLMGADVPSGQYVPAQGMYVSYAAPDAAEAARVFEALAARGVVTVPLAAAFFTTAFGMCVDRFGTPWMITAADPRASWDR
jgi:uncharacterized glyoxalase superfamily protein PhnB